MSVIFSFKGYSTTWQIIDKISGASAALMSFFNFSTLYTNIPHNRLFKMLSELIHFDAKQINGDFITVNKYGAKWTTKGK